MASSSWYQRSELQQWNRRVNGQRFVTFIYLSTPWLLDDTASAFQPTTTSTRKATFTKWVNDTYDLFILSKSSFPKHCWSPKGKWQLLTKYCGIYFCSKCANYNFISINFGNFFFSKKKWEIVSRKETDARLWKYRPQSTDSEITGTGSVEQIETSPF